MKDAVAIGLLGVVGEKSREIADDRPLGRRGMQDDGNRLLRGQSPSHVERQPQRRHRLEPAAVEQLPVGNHDQPFGSQLDLAVREDHLVAAAPVVIETPERAQRVRKVPPVVGGQIAGLVQHETRVVGRNAQREELDPHPGERAGIRAAVAKPKCRIRHRASENGYRRYGR